MIKYKLREVANDLGVTAKEVIEVLSKYVGGVPKKQVTILTDEELSLPMSPCMMQEQLEYVVEMVNSWG